MAPRRRPGFVSPALGRAATRAGLLPVALLALFTAPSAHAQVGWQASLSGSAFVAYTQQTSMRGIDGPASWGWMHGSLGRSFAHGSVTADAMLSLDPLVQGDCGYPRLMAGWAVCSAAPLEDHAHAQPFVMGLGLRAARTLGPARLSVDGALVGDPPLGVKTWLHRASAAADPVMPVTAAELTPAHAVGPVVTVGVGIGPVGLEGSRFNGAGHAVDRWDVAVGDLHSWAARVRWTPLRQLELYGGVGELEASGGHHEGAGAMRVESLAAEWRAGLGDAGSLALTLAGSRRVVEEHAENAVLLEGLGAIGRQTVFARLERTDRSILAFDAAIHADGTHEHNVIFMPYDVSELSVGYGFRALDVWRAGLSVGARYGLSHVSKLLFYNYGELTAHSFSVYLNLGSVAPGAGHEHAGHMGAPASPGRMGRILRAILRKL
jgi:hypothetical protein